MYITPASFWYKDRAFSLRFKDLQNWPESAGSPEKKVAPVAACFQFKSWPCDLVPRSNPDHPLL
jgi:hypothetical protein